MMVSVEKGKKSCFHQIGKSFFLTVFHSVFFQFSIFFLFQVNCLADGVLVDIDLRDKNFNGVMYVKGHSNDQVVFFSGYFLLKCVFFSIEIISSCIYFSVIMVF